MNRAIFVLVIPSLFSISCSLIIPDPYSPESISALISKYNSSRSEATLLEYARSMEEKQRYRELGEPSRGGLPPELETYLINLLQNGRQNDKRNVIKFYIKATNLTGCSSAVATYKDKTVIGDFIQIAEQLNSEDKLGALKLIESIRRNTALYKPELRDSKGSETKAIDKIFQIYENWWTSSDRLEDKLKIDPLKNAQYKWIELE